MTRVSRSRQLTYCTFVMVLYKAGKTDKFRLSTKTLNLVTNWLKLSDAREYRVPNLHNERQEFRIHLFRNGTHRLIESDLKFQSY